ncbi:MAG: DUF4469 domain-containing protein [Prevotellaceae bacterium]|jgi:hypothetical protein|nr:DUF4469 domain-containing protein [Prevotellaceae bacterium]
MKRYIESIWKIWLRINVVSKSELPDYYAEVSTVGETVRNKDIAEIIIEKGSELRYETLLSVMGQIDEIKRVSIVSGKSVQDGVAHYSPRVYGPWHSLSDKLNRKIHSVGVSITPSPELRNLLKYVKIKLLGIKDSGAFIGCVSDSEKGSPIEVITPDETVFIKGNKIKIFPENEEELGVFFTNVNTGDIYQVTHKLTVNLPKEIVARIPDLPVGTYLLTVVTCFVKSRQHRLQSPRIIEYQQPLTVV